MSVVFEAPRVQAPASVSREAAAFRILDTLPPGRCLRISGLRWDDYLEFDRWRDEFRPGLKIAFFRGELEFMTTSFEYDGTSRALQDVIKQFGLAFGWPVRAAGSTTFHKEAEEAGMEPDKCFYVRNAAAVRGVKDIDLAIHPPPDLALEVDRTNSSLPKHPIYSVIGVPELWRVKGEVIQFFLRQPPGGYAEASASLAFPLVKSAELSRFFFGTDWPDDTALIVAARDWAAALA